MWLVKYLLFFSTAIVSVVGAGAVIAGIIVFLIFEHFLPPVITDLIRSNLSFLDSLPAQLAVLGTVVCLSTLLGCCGAILEGNIGKWLLITYTIELTIFVALNIHTAVVLHLAHKKSHSSGSGAEASPLIMDLRTKLDTETIDATYNAQLSGHEAETTVEKPFLVRQRRGFIPNVAGDLINTAKGFVHDTTSTVGDQIKKGKDLAGNVIHKVGDKVESGVNKVGEKIENGKNFVVNTVDSTWDTAHKIGGVVLAGYSLVKDNILLVLSMFKALSKEEEEAVKLIKPILGMYTTPVFRLTTSSVVMSAWAGAIGVEVIFILLNIYHFTTKNRLYEDTYVVC